MAVDPTLLAIKSLNNSMKTAQDPFKTTVRGMQNSANVVMLVRRIQNKIILQGVCSDTEFEYLRLHSDWDQQYLMDKHTVDSEQDHVYTRHNAG